MENRPVSLDIPALKSFEGCIRVPGSKSISNRALLLSALAQGDTRLHYLLQSDDTLHLGNALKQLGIDITFEKNGTEAIVKGLGGTFPNSQGDFFLGNAGTAMRSLTAALSLGHGNYTLHGEPRMHERPIGDLISALRTLGAEITCTQNEGFPPLEIKANGLHGKSVTVRGNISSQYLTALLLCAPYTEHGLTITVEGELISKPYIALTIAMMKDFGIVVKNNHFESFEIPKGTYIAPGDYDIEGDASSATYPLAAAAISRSKIRVEGVGSKSIQGDIRFTEVLEAMGAKIHFAEKWVECVGKELKGVDLDLNHIPDAAMTVAPLALFAKGTTKIRGIASWKVKETDRLAAISTELRKLGAIVETDEDSITITPPEKINSASIDTYNDHRMAMCFSLVALGGIPITIMDPACVNKTYPSYFDDFFRLAK